MKNAELEGEKKEGQTETTSTKHLFPDIRYASTVQFVTQGVGVLHPLRKKQGLGKAI